MKNTMTITENIIESRDVMHHGLDFRETAHNAQRKLENIIISGKRE